MSYQQDVFGLIARFSGQENILSVPRVFCEVTGSLEAGMLLSQLLFWSDKGHDPEGWFYKSYVEWKQHVFLTEYQIRKFSKVFEDAGFLETKLKKVNGSPTLHYRIKRAEFSEWILKNLRNESLNFGNPNLKIQESYNKETEITTETTTETTVDQGEGSKIVASPPPTAAPVSHRKMGSDDYDHPITATAPTPPVAATPPKRTDGRKFVGGFIPAGKGTNPVEIWYESFSVQDQETRLTAPDEDDLRHCTDLAKLRNVIATFRKQGFKRKKNIQLILEWYRDGIPAKYIGESNERSYNGSGGAKRPVGAAQQPHPAMQWGTADPNDPF